MLPVKSLRTALGDLLAAQVASLAPVAANKIALISEAFVPGENLVYGDLVFATFTGSAPKGGAAGAQQVGIDPTTGDQKITILAPIGGWRWECTADPTPAQTIWGFALVNDGEDALLGTELLPTPVVIQAATEFLDLGSVEITFVLQPMM